MRLTNYDGGDGGDVVGFKSEMGSMLELLIQGPRKLHLISIFGMDGLEKTTRAWCYVSQVYETKKLLLELLGHVVQLSDTIPHMDYLRRYFPNNQNGNRIIFTTRQHDLVSEAQSNIIPQPLDYLSENESWELLRMKVFKKESCPEELLEVGTQIAKGCKGSPISIVLAAGVLARTEKIKDQWTLTSYILGDANNHVKGIIDQCVLRVKHGTWRMRRSRN